MSTEVKRTSPDSRRKHINWRPGIVFPFLKTARNYDKTKFQADILAALTVALVALPQSMAFAIIAGVNPIYGLNAIIVGCLVGSLLGSSRFLHTGPTNTSSIVIAGVMVTFMQTKNPIAILFLLSFLTGLFQVGAALFKLGNLTQFISRSVIIGFMGGASLLIIFSQIPNLIGIPKQPNISILKNVIYLSKTVAGFNLTTLLIGVGTILLTVFLNRYSPKTASGVPILPTYLMAVLASALVIYLLGLQKEGVAIVGAIPASLPPFSQPIFEWPVVQQVIPGALALAFISTAEAVASSKSVAALAGDRLNLNQEFLGQGMAKIAVSFFSGMPVSGSFTRTALNFRAGAQTRFAAFYSGIMLVFLVIFFGPVIKYIPVAGLAGIIIVIATKMVSPQQVRIAFKTTTSDALVMSGTFLATLLLRLDIAIFIGVGLSLILFLRQVQHPKLIELNLDEAGGFSEMPQSNGRRHIPEISIVHVEGDIFFGAAEFLEEEISKFAVRPELKVLILRLKRACCLDATAVMSLQQLYEQLRRNHKLLLISGVTDEVAQIFRRSGLEKIIGRENIFSSEQTIFKSTRTALERARQFIEQSGDVDFRVRYFSNLPQKERS